ncbi:SNF2-related protein [Solimonas terrae]|uniref:DEAD/DEAH box helicase n=1 Tax=Solimonas terrae TaxID=1396819 RepID=A0A6M2BQQ5_9GAMM|nr:DEAD/DEAH box helicase [Solimonas terrae]NGY04962.1 DEAD/DEAH box helicase [Solimonas terrae]
MDKVQLGYLEAEKAVTITGAGPRLLRSPMFAAHFCKEGGQTGPDGTLRLPTGTKSLSQQFRTIEKLLQNAGVGFDLERGISSALDAVREESEEFARFSALAAEIWGRNLDTEEFRRFVAAVEAACVGRTFYRKQLLSAFHLAFAHNACNFSVPGAGKTSIVYAAYAYLKASPAVDGKAIDRLLIVGPLSSFKAWEDEYRAIFNRTPITRRISGATPAEDRNDYLKGITPEARGVELTLTSYQTLANSEEGFTAFLRRFGPSTMMVLDEAHYIKNEDGFWAAAALRLARLASCRVVLTGTPAPNGYEDLVNLFRFIYPMRDVVGFPSSTLRAMSDGSMERAVPQLKERIKPFFTRIRKSDLGLPPFEEHRVPVPMGAAQERIYRLLETKIVPQFRRDLASANVPMRVRARLIRLRQAAVNPELLLLPIERDALFDAGIAADYSVTEQEVVELVRAFNVERDLERLKICERLARTTLDSGGKVLIWSYFLGNLDRLMRLFRGSVPFLEKLTGVTPVGGGDDDAQLLGTREEIIDRFHSTPGPAVLVANPQAVGESISLHKACRTAIYYDRDFNAGRFIQSKDRIHRYNPAGGGLVSYFYLGSSDTVDDDIDQRLQMKERRLIDLVDSEDIPLLTASGDDDDDIRAVLEAYERRKGV